MLPVDGGPASAAQISFTTQIGNFFGQQNFQEELYKKNQEAAIELRTGVAGTVPVVTGKTLTGVNIVTNSVINVNPFGNVTNIGFINPSSQFHLRGTDTEGRSGLAGGDGTAGAASGKV